MDGEVAAGSVDSGRQTETDGRQVPEKGRMEVREKGRGEGDPRSGPQEVQVADRLSPAVRAMP